MAICVITALNDLDEDFILTPERYHPGRRLAIQNESYSSITDFIELVSVTITKNEMSKSNKSVYIINTGDVYEGYIRGNKSFEDVVNSNKKVINVGDVIISRLRPYLRQVAYVDNALQNINDEKFVYAASTEFYVLRSKTEDSIAFLVPFLLSDEVQKVFANSVEGSQHPRFKEEDLLGLVIPNVIVEQREELSQDVIESIQHIRSYEKGILEGINYFNTQLERLMTKQ